MKKELESRFVTRQYMLAQDFEVYYYSDSGMAEVRTHSHDYYEFYFFLEGDVCMKIGERSYLLKYGDIILIPPQIPHCAIIQNPHKPYRRFVFWISCSYADQLQKQSDSYGYLIERATKRQEYVLHQEEIAFRETQAKVLRLLEEMRQDRFGKDAKIPLCIGELVLHLNREAYAQEHPIRERAMQGLYEMMMDYIEEHLKENLDLNELSSIFHVSKYHISHVFKDETGISVHQYILKKRLDACKSAIRSGDKITSVYPVFGFRDYSAFYRAFRKEYGISPKEYREMLEKLEAMSGSD